MNPRALPLAASLLATLLLPSARAAEPAAAAKSRAAKTTATIKLSEVVNDRDIDQRLAKIGGEWIEDGRATPAKTLISQLGRTNFPLKTPAPAKKKLAPEEIFTRGQPGTLAVAGIFKCGRCDKWHAGGASGFMLDASGVAVTAYHVVNQPTNSTLIILTGDGRVVPVREVLAANRRTDVALLRVEGDGYTALPLGTNAPVGSSVCVISHPDDHFFTLSQGIVSRYFLPGASRTRPDIAIMAITADFAKGSSGGPVFNEHGAVVGIVSSTISTYYNLDKDHHKDNLQMVFKHCIPSRYILELIK